MIIHYCTKMCIVKCLNMKTLHYISNVQSPKDHLRHIVLALDLKVLQG